MIANLVERILVAARQQGRGVGDGGAVLVEHPIAQFLRALHLALFGGKPYLERAEPAKGSGKIREALDILYARRGRQRLEPGHRRLRRGPDVLRPQHLNQPLRRSRQLAVLHRHPRDRTRPDRIDAVFEDSEITGVQQRCDATIAGV